MQDHQRREEEVGASEAAEETAGIDRGFFYAAALGQGSRGGPGQARKKDEATLEVCAHCGTEESEPSGPLFEMQARLVLRRGRLPARGVVEPQEGVPVGGGAGGDGPGGGAAAPTRAV